MFYTPLGSVFKHKVPPGGETRGKSDYLFMRDVNFEATCVIAAAKK